MADIVDLHGLFVDHRINGSHNSRCCSVKGFYMKCSKNFEHLTEVSATGACYTRGF